MATELESNMGTIDEMTDNQKTCLLVDEMGWRLEFPPDWNEYDAPFADIVDKDGQEIDVLWDVYPSQQWNKFNLYNISNMHLAWIVLNWAHEKATHIADPFSLQFDKWYYGFFFGAQKGDEFYKTLPSLPPAKAQRIWLDRILALLIETGHIKVAA